MFFFLPTGSSAELSRRPVVTLTITALCVASYVWTTFVDPPNESALATYFSPDYRAEHPEIFDDSSDEESVAAKKDFIAEVRATVERNGGAERRWALVPARGVRQVGWLSSPFVHFGIWHLVGNLLFLALVGPLLEEAWGRSRFALFYALAALAAGLVQFALNTSSMAAIGGASGAIAGCMGAFTVRFASAKIRFHWFFLLLFRGGTFWAPAWLSGLAWFGRELLSASGGGEDGVATGAHVGGFVVGGIVALSMKGLGYERELLTVAESAEERQRREGYLADAMAALARDDVGVARDALLALQKEMPAYPGLARLLAEVDLKSGRGQMRLEKVLRSAMTDRSRVVEDLVTKHWALIDPRAFSGNFAHELAKRLQKARPAVDPSIIAALLGASGGSAAAAPKKLTGVKLLDASLMGVGVDALSISVAGNVNDVPFSKLAAVYVGLVPLGGVRELVVELVMKNEPPVALRFRGSDPAMARLHPDKSPLSAWQVVLGELAQRSGLEVQTSGWRQYESLEALTSTWSD